MHSKVFAHRFFLIAAMLLVIAQSAAATVVRVDHASIVLTPDGTTWATAYPSLQAALTAVGFPTSPVEIWVAHGVYKPGTSVDSTFEMKNNVAVYGGFNGTESVRAERNWTTNITVLSGDIDGDDTVDSAGVSTTISGTNAHHVVTFMSDTTAVLDGVTVTGGVANGSASDCPGGCGGGVLMWGSSSILNHVRIVGNRAAFAGGGVEINGSWEGVSPTLTNVVISGNLAGGYGGGVDAQGTTASLTNGVISGNAAALGGGIEALAAPLILTNVTISGNSASMASGIFVSFYDTVHVRNSILWGNVPAASTVSSCSVYCGVDITYSDVDLGSSELPPFTGTGNVNADPQFVTAITDPTPTTTGNLRLQETSPAIDAGNDTVASPSLPAGDLLGHSRIAGTHVDMGAYEYGGAAPTPDLTITKSHTGNFAECGQYTYTLTIRNVGTGVTTGTITVEDTAPAGMTITAMSGDGWSCSLDGYDPNYEPGCQRTLPLPAWAYPTDDSLITVHVSVGSTPDSSLTNTATVSGGGEVNTANNSASDETAVLDADTPVMTTQPMATSAQPKGTATFIAHATAVAQVGVQWFVSTDGGSNWIGILEATSDTLVLTNVSTGMNGNQYHAVFGTCAGTVTSDAATLTVSRTADFAPTITLQPASHTVMEGQSVSFTSTASGQPTPTVQWERSGDGGANWIPLSDSEVLHGATSTTLTIVGAIVEISGDRFHAVFTNGVSPDATSEPAILTVTNALAAPNITVSPVSVAVNANDAVTFSATAEGDLPMTAGWQISTNGGGTWKSISGSAASCSSTPCSATYNIASATASQSGNLYRAVFTNAAGSATSSAASLTVNTTRLTKTNVTVTITSDPNPADILNEVLFTIVVHAPSGMTSPEGTVEVFDGRTLLGTAMAGPSGMSDRPFGFAKTWDTSGVHSITAEYSGDTNYNPASSPVLTQVVGTAADLRISKLGTYDATLNVLTWTITVYNDSSSMTSGVQVKDTLAGGTTIDSVFVPNGTYVAKGRTVTAILGDIDAGLAKSFTIFARLSKIPPSGAIYSNTATLTSAIPDPNLANNTATANVIIP